MACEIYIPNSKETYKEFENHKAAIDNDLGELIWMELPTKKASRVKQSMKGDFTKEDMWNEYFEWLGNTALKFQDTFNKY